MSSKMNQHVIDLTTSRDLENNMQRKRKREDADVAGPPQKKILGEGNISRSTDPQNNIHEGVSVSKRRAEDDGGMPQTRSRKCRNLTSSTEHTLNVRSSCGKRKVDHDGDAPNKRGRRSDSNAADPGVSPVAKKRKATDDGEAPKKKSRCSNIISISEPSAQTSHITISSGSGSSEVKEDVSAEDVIVISSAEVEKVSVNDDDVSHDFGTVSAEEEKIFEMSSSANTSRADFEQKYCQLAPIGSGGFGSVYAGYRRSDLLQVAIKHIPKGVKLERVKCNGKSFHILLEVALMLKAAGPGSVGQAAAVSLLDWYFLDQELILVMERPAQSQDLFGYLKAHRGSLDEQEAKMILRQLVDAAIDLNSKGIFHRDIKLQNILVQLDSDVPRVRVIDFGCGSFSTEKSFTSFFGTFAYAPPEWLVHQTYGARPTTVWQLGALFYLSLKGHAYFSTASFMHLRNKFNSGLSPDVKTLLNMCLAVDPSKRATLEELQLFLRNLSPPSPQDH